MRRSRFKVITTLCVLLSVSFAVLIAMLISNSILLDDLWSKPDWVATSFCKTSDKEPPIITLNGDSSQSIKVGETYTEQGAEVVDDCDEVELKISGTVKTDTVGIYNIEYISTDSSGNEAKLVRTINIVPEYHGTIYLTFDDGPGPYTNTLLDVLAKYNVKATFFVTGRGDDELIAREYNEGHAIGLHSFTHDYAYIYQSLDEYFDDLNRIQERVKNITGRTTNLMRFPGGSSNTVSARYDGGSHIMSRLVNEVESRGFVYFDWNVSSGDAGNVWSADEVGDIVIDSLIEYGDSVVLQHDIKDFSVDAVERIIQYGLLNGYEFKKLDANSYTAHHGVNN